jgi:hypothetical protein
MRGGIGEAEAVIVPPARAERNFHPPKRVEQKPGPVAFSMVGAADREPNTTCHKQALL